MVEFLTYNLYDNRRSRHYYHKQNRHQISTRGIDTKLSTRGTNTDHHTPLR